MPETPQHLQDHGWHRRHSRQQLHHGKFFDRSPWNRVHKVCGEVFNLQWCSYELSLREDDEECHNSQITGVCSGVTFGWSFVSTRKCFPRQIHWSPHTTISTSIFCSSLISQNICLVSSSLGSRILMNYYFVDRKKMQVIYETIYELKSKLGFEMLHCIAC